ncbi:MAG: 4-(cytidine 5'-diphospho)-2-C-methyl-D-erythritol kinase [Alphaproteobacteria bacterium]|nr:4-(cytidine 5'-diphospho)-2-C-methyl-D-erythritol kinase [Alphaproteobacteria bacterium]
MLARAKINLHLHITGRADNGYHLLDSLVVFTSLADEIQIRSSDHYDLKIHERMGSQPLSSTDNLVTRATYLLAHHLGIPPYVSIDLFKNIPLSAGLGGGSADAAAILTLLKKHWKLESDDLLQLVAASLGSDILACLYNVPVIMRETGNKLIPAPSIPKLYALLVNPNMPCPTPAAYRIYAENNSQFSNKVAFPDEFRSPDSLCRFLKDHTRNDLTEAAISLVPQIKNILDWLSVYPDCLLARLSGSGATCFGLFAEKEHAEKAGQDIIKDHQNTPLDLRLECVEVNGE